MPRGTPAKKKSSSSTGLILDISDTLLTTIRDAARLSTVPFFSEAADLALGILAIIQGTKDNKDGFKYLATDVLTLVYAIIRISEEQKGLSTKDLENVRELLGTLSSIERFARREVSQRLILRVIRHKSDVGKIQRYRETLKNSLDLFGLKASLSIQENISRIAQRQDEVLNALQDSSRTRQDDGSLDQEGPERRPKVDNRDQDKERVERERERLRETETKAKLELERAEKEGRLEQDRLAESERLEKRRADEAKEAAERRAQETARIEAERVERENLARQRSEMERLAREKELLESEKRAKEALRKYHEEERTRAAAEEQAAQDKHHRAAWKVEPSSMPPFKVAYSSKNPFRRPHQPAFPVIHSSHGSFTSVGGDYVKTDNSNHENNTNSGNTTTTTVMDSHNDSSALTGYSQYPKRRKNR